MGLRWTDEVRDDVAGTGTDQTHGPQQVRRVWLWQQAPPGGLWSWLGTAEMGCQQYPALEELMRELWLLSLLGLKLHSQSWEGCGSVECSTLFLWAS